MVHRRRQTARIAALRLGACAAALFACAAHADGPAGKTVPRGRAAEGLYAVVTAASGAESPSEARLPIFTLTLPPAASFVPAMRVGAHMTVGNQPRMGSAVVFSASVPF